MTETVSELVGRLRTDVGFLRKRADGPLHTIANDIDEAATTLASAEAKIARLEAARFLPLGDNHHNAVLCPYCNPERIDPAAERSRADAAEAKIAALTAELQQRDELLIKATVFRFADDLYVQSRGPSVWGVSDGSHYTEGDMSFSDAVRFAEGIALARARSLEKQDG